METLRDLSTDGQREMGMGRQGCTQPGLPAQGKQCGSRILPLSSPPCSGAPTLSPQSCPHLPLAAHFPKLAFPSPYSVQPRRFLCRPNLIYCATAGAGLL